MGSEFLENAGAIINYKNKIVQINNIKVKFSNVEENNQNLIQDNQYSNLKSNIYSDILNKQQNSVCESVIELGRSNADLHRCTISSSPVVNGTQNVSEYENTNVINTKHLRGNKLESNTDYNRIEDAYSENSRSRIRVPIENKEKLKRIL